MCFQGCEYRERLLAIDFLVFYYFLREQRLMENFSFPSNSVHSSLLTPFNLSLFAIPMCTLTNLGMMFLLSLIPFFTLFSLPKFLRCCIFVLTLLGLIFWHAILLRGDVSLGKLMFRMFTQFHNFMEVCSLS